MIDWCVTFCEPASPDTASFLVTLLVMVFLRWEPCAFNPELRCPVYDRTLTEVVIPAVPLSGCEFGFRLGIDPSIGSMVMVRPERAIDAAGNESTEGCDA